MSAILKSKVVLFIGITALLGVGTYLSVRERPPSKTEDPVVKQEKTPVRNAASPYPSFPPPPADVVSQEPVKEPSPVRSNAPIPKEALAALREAFAGMGQLRNHGRSHDGSEDKQHKKIDPSEKAELRAKIKDSRGEVAKAVNESEVARKQLLEAIKDEKDPYAKKELARLLSGTTPEIQSKYYMALANDPATDNQSVAVEMLGSLHTQTSLKSLVGMAESPSVDAQVRSGAIRAVGMSVAFASDNADYQQSARSALIGMIQPQYDASVRQDAYRAISMQTTFSPEDERVISQAIQNETDPQVRRLAEFTQSVMDARKGAEPR